MQIAKNFIRQHWRQLTAIKAPPESVALGFALGVFLGFTPFFGLKTLLALLLAWLLRSNKLAAFLGVTLHDALLPFMPALLRLEYQLGYWSLNSPHHFAPKIRLRHEHLHVALHWTEVFASAKPLLVGSIIVGLPLAFASYFIVRAVLFKTERTAVARVEFEDIDRSGPSTCAADHHDRVAALDQLHHGRPGAASVLPISHRGANPDSIIERHQLT